MNDVRTVAARDATLGLHSIDDYAPLIGAAAVERITRKAERLRSAHITHVSSTYYGGGVAEMLTPLTLVMNAMGIETGWRMIQGTPEFFACTKKLHNALQGAPVELTDEDIAAYQQVNFENGTRLHLEEHDAVIVHDPQPLPLIRHADRQVPWLWQCHVDLSAPHRPVWELLRPFIEQYSAAVFSLRDYAHELTVPQRFILPAINPFSAKNREMSDAEIDACLAQHEIPTERPLVVQISRFDRWKDPAGVIEAVRLAHRAVDCTLVLLGNTAVDDPEGQVVLETIYSSCDERILVVSVDDPLLVNALQRRATVVLQKSIREGFGLTVTEAMWKGAAVIGGKVGGIRRQIIDGESGFLVETIDQAAQRIVELISDPDLRRRIGAKARESVRANFLMSRLVEDWIDLLAAHVDEDVICGS
jgi:trehalose synthase